MDKILHEYTVKDGKKLRKFIVQRPNRRQNDEADTQYAIELSNCVRKGILTKSMLSKKYEDSGGILSEESAKQLSGLYHRLEELISEQARLKTVKTQTQKNKEKLEKLEEEMVDVRRRIVDVESNNLTLFNNTAESRAQSKTLIWYTTHLLFEKDGDKLIPFFDGADFEEKLDQYYEREDEEDNKTYLEIMQRAGTAMAFWYYNQGLPTDKFKVALKEFLDEHGEKADKGEEPPSEESSDE